MSYRPDPIQYAERLYNAIRAANFSPISFLTFGNAVKDGVPLRNMSRIAVEPFMRVVGEMLDLEQQVPKQDDVTEADVVLASSGAEPVVPWSGIETVPTTRLAGATASAPGASPAPAAVTAAATAPGAEALPAEISATAEETAPAPRGPSVPAASIEAPTVRTAGVGKERHRRNR